MFHLRDGWYFERLEGGEVHIFNAQEELAEALGGLKRSTNIQLYIPAAEWASIVASVSVKGETAETFRQAETFHMGEASNIP